MLTSLAVAELSGKAFKNIYDAESSSRMVKKQIQSWNVSEQKYKATFIINLASTVHDVKHVTSSSVYLELSNAFNICYAKGSECLTSPTVKRRVASLHGN